MMFTVSQFAVGLRPLALLVMALAAAVGPATAVAQEKNKDAPKESSPEALAHYSDAANLQNNGEFELAAQEWSNFLQRFHGDPLTNRVRSYLGVCHLQAKEYDKAAEILAEVVAADETLEAMDEVYLNLGWAQYSHALTGPKEWFAKAQATLATLIAKYPKSKLMDQALFHYGEVLYHEGKQTEAIKSYTRLVQEYPASKLRPDGLYALGVGLQELKQHAQAGDVFDTFLKDFSSQHPLADEVKMRKADTLLEGGDPAAAESLFAALAQVKTFPLADYAILRQAYCAALAKNDARAAQLYARIPHEYPQTRYVAEATLAAGRAFYRARQWDQATEWLRKVIKDDPDHSAEAAHWLCRLLLANNQPAKAAELAARMIPKAGQGEYLAHLKLDEADALYELSDRRAEALDSYLRLVKQHADHEAAPQALYNAAYAAMDLKRHKEGIDLAEKFLGAYPKDRLLPDVLYVRAECHVLAGHYSEAEKAFDHLLGHYREHPDVENWHLRRATATYLDKRFQNTVDQLSAVIATLRSGAAIAEGQYLVGASYLKLDRHEEAASALAASLAADPKWRAADETMLSLARAQEKLGHPEQAKQMLDQLMAEFPTSEVRDQAHYQLAELHFAAHEFPTAQAQYAAVTEKWPQSPLVPHALYGQGWAQLRNADFAGAAKSLTRLITQHADHPLIPMAHHGRAMAREQMGDHRGGSDDVEVFLRSNPTGEEKSSALYVRGLCLIGLEQHEAAIGSFQSILKEDESYARTDKVLYELGWAYEKLGQLDPSVDAFGQLATRFPQSTLAAEAHFHVGQHHYSRGQFEAALTSYSKASERSAGGELSEKVLYKLAWSHYQLNQFREALDAFTKQVEACPAGSLLADGLFMTAECLFRLENYTQALPAFKRAEAAGSTNPTMAVLTRLHAGQSAAQLKQWEESLEWLSPIATKYPDSPYLTEATYEQGWALQNLANWDDARKAYELVIENSRDEIGARARFMLGELHFTQKNFVGAISEFLRLMYGYGGDQASPSIKRWQAKGGLEAGRCAAVLAGKATDSTKKAAHLANAKKYLRYVAEKHAGTDEADIALEQLKKYTS